MGSSAMGSVAVAPAEWVRYSAQRQVLLGKPGNLWSSSEKGGQSHMTTSRALIPHPVWGGWTFSDQHGMYYGVTTKETFPMSIPDTIAIDFISLKDPVNVDRVAQINRLLRQIVYSGEPADIKEYFSHKLSASIVGRFSHIAMEDLNIKGLAAGMLAKSVHNAAW